MPIGTAFGDDRPFISAVPEIEKYKADIETNYYTAMIQSRDLPTYLASTHLPGTPVSVDYYNQILGEDEAPHDLDVGLDNATQQYREILGLDIRVTEGINIASLDAIEMTANISYILDVRVGDMVKTTMSDNVNVLLKVKTVTPLSHVQFPVYQVVLTIDSIIGENPSRYTNLKAKVAIELKYDRNHVSYGHAPLLLKSDTVYRDNILKIEPVIVNLFISKFAKPSGRILLPTDEARIVDTGLEEFLYEIIDISNYPNLSRVVRTRNFTKESNNVYDAMLSQSFDILKYVKREPTFRRTVSTAKLDNILLFKTYSQTRLLVKENLLPKYKPNDLSYLFTIDFYNDTEDISLLEREVLNGIKGKQINVDVINDLLSSIDKWTPYEQYYYIPVLIYLMKLSVSNLGGLI